MVLGKSARLVVSRVSVSSVKGPPWAFPGLPIHGGLGIEAIGVFTFFDTF